MTKIKTYNKTELLVEGGYLVDGEGNAIGFAEDFFIACQYEKLTDWMAAANYLAGQPEYAPKPSMKGFKNPKNDEFFVAHYGELEELLAAKEEEADQINKALDNRARLEYVSKVINNRFKELAVFLEKEELTVVDNYDTPCNKFADEMLLLNVEDLASIILGVTISFEKSEHGNAWMLNGTEPWLYDDSPRNCVVCECD